MDGFASIFDQQRPIRILRTFLQEGNIPHALLFAGTKGVGKRTAALHFAMAANCEENSAGADSGPCLACGSCGKIVSGNHPDIIHIRPAGQGIKISQIRDLCRTLSMKPYEAKWRVVIISDAELMTSEAGNALLKVLEEPPHQTVLILTTDQASALLPTILSRCQRIRFTPISRTRLASMLVDALSLNPGDADLIAAMANGSYAKAVELDRQQWIAKRYWLINEIDALPERPIESLLAFAEKIAEDKEMLSDTLNIIISWFRDLVLYPYCPNKIVHQDLLEKIQKASKRFPTKRLIEKIEVVRSTQRDIHNNANARLALEAMIFRLAQAEPMAPFKPEAIEYNREVSVVG